MKIQYLSFAGISKTNGPAINEQQLIPALFKKMENNALFLIPKQEDKILGSSPLHEGAFIPTSKHLFPDLWLRQYYFCSKTLKRLLRGIFCFLTDLSRYFRTCFKKEF